MVVEKMCGYSISITTEEDTAIKKVVDILDDIITELDKTNCYTIEDGVGNTIDAFDIGRAIDTLNSVLYAEKME